jgi:tRNA (mo5U34)-methyltransferase
MKRRGAERVVAVDHDERYLEQARFAAAMAGTELELRKLSVYDIDQLGEKFDIVLFMGVFYHLRYPLLALDLIRQHCVKELLVFQSMQRGSAVLEPVAADYPFSEEAVFARADFPCLYFIEKSYAGDPTNWWIPNRACAEALLRCAGFEVLQNPESEVYLCRPVQPHPKEP